MQSEAPHEGSPGKEFLPKFFREGPLRLYACHHFPTLVSANAEAVLICNATGHEYERCHRAIRQLAFQFARTGHHTMRFDYYGTGDSAGESTQVSLARWRRDVSDAIDECRQLSGRKQACVVGLRLGATLAAQAVAEREDVDNLVLWAPVIDGQSLLAEWKHEQSAHERRRGRPASEVLNEVLGFPLTDTFRAELRNGLALPPPNPGLRRVLIITEHGTKDGIQEIAEVLSTSGATVSIAPPDAPAIWRSEPHEAIVAFKLLRRIVSWLNEAKR